MQEIIEYITKNNIGKYLENESLSKYTTYKVGGNAKVIVYLMVLIVIVPKDIS